MFSGAGPGKWQMENGDLKLLQEKIGYLFKDESILNQAVTHSSYAYESRQKDITDNGRLEFFGDSVLGFVISEYLLKGSPGMSEGDLTRQRALIVNRDSLSKRARELDMPQYLLLGRGEEKTGGRQNATNLAGVLEALIAAVYFDGGLEEARRFITRVIL